MRPLSQRSHLVETTGAFESASLYRIILRLRVCEGDDHRAKSQDLWKLFDWLRLNERADKQLIDSISGRM